MIYNTFKNHSNTSKSHFHTKYFLSQNESYNTMISDLSCPESRKNLKVIKTYILTQKKYITKKLLKIPIKWK